MNNSPDCFWERKGYVPGHDPESRWRLMAAMTFNFFVIPGHDPEPRLDYFTIPLPRLAPHMSVSSALLDLALPS